MAEFFNMGGYAGYVWPAYISSAGVLGAIAAMIWRRRRRLQTQLDRIAAARQGGSVETPGNESAQAS